MEDLPPNFNCVIPFYMSTIENLRKQFNRFIFASLSSEELIDVINRDASEIIRTTLQYPRMHEQRKHYNYSPLEKVRMNAQRFANGFELTRKFNNRDQIFRSLEFIVDYTGFSLSVSAFLVLIELIGTDIQVKYWKDLVLNGKVIGAYAQTQLGHGSNVQFLQTQAHYDEKTQTFRMNSPTVTSCKFWPGVLGIFCTHAVVQAKTFVKGKSIGIQTFVVPLRDNNLQCLPGVSGGDIGPKLGFVKVDNGYIKMENITLPRQSMLMKYISISQDGIVKGLENKNAIKYAYGSMLNLRVKLTNSFSIFSMVIPAILAWINGQKLMVRKNIQLKKKMVEAVCTGYSYIILNREVTNIFNKYLNNIQKENYNEAQRYLIDCHIYSSTFKALAAWKCIEISKDFTISSYTNNFLVAGNSVIFAQFIPSATYQGDNSVLLQQTAKYVLMKSTELQQNPERPSSTVQSDNLADVLKMLQFIVAKEVKRVKQLFEQQSAKGTSFQLFWNEIYQRQIISLSKLWGCKALMQTLIKSLSNINEFKSFYQKIARCFVQYMLSSISQIPFYGFKIELKQAWKQFTEEELQKVLFKLGYPIYQLENHIDKYVTFQYMPRQQKWMTPRL